MQNEHEPALQLYVTTNVVKLTRYPLVISHWKRWNYTKTYSLDHRASMNSLSMY